MIFWLTGSVSPAWAGDDWTIGDTARQAVVTGLLIADWGQTREAAKHPPQFGEGLRYRETNAVLGPNPTVGKINNYFAASAIGHAAISYLLPHSWRPAWQYVFIGMEVQAIRVNYAAGIKIKF